METSDKMKQNEQKIIKEIVEEYVEEYRMTTAIFVNKMITKIMRNEIKEDKIRERIISCLEDEEYVEIIKPEESDKILIAIKIMEEIIEKEYIKEDTKAKAIIKIHNKMERCGEKIYEILMASIEKINRDEIYIKLIEDRELGEMIGSYEDYDYIMAREKLKKGMKKSAKYYVDRMRESGEITHEELKMTEIFDVYIERGKYVKVETIEEGINMILRQEIIGNKRIVKVLEEIRELTKINFNVDIQENIKEVIRELYENKLINEMINTIEQEIDYVTKNIYSEELCEAIDKYYKNIKEITECNVCYENKTTYKYHCMAICIDCIENTREKKINQEDEDEEESDNELKCMFCNGD